MVTGVWGGCVAIAQRHAEGPQAYQAIQEAKARLREAAEKDGVTAPLEFRLVAPAKVEGRVLIDTDPSTGIPLPVVYQLTARAVQEN